MSDRGGVNNLIVILSISTIIINLIIFNNILLAQSPDFQWAKQAGGTDSDIARDITTDGNNNSYITGGYNDQANFGSITLTNRSSVFNIFVAKYNEFGEVVWAKQASQNIDTWGGGAGNAIETDGSGNIFVTGTFSYGLIFGNDTLRGGEQEIFLVKYDPDGNVLWATQAGGVFEYDFDSGEGIATDAWGNCVITGKFYAQAKFGTITLTSTGNPYDPVIFVAKYDGAGNVLWAKQATGDYRGSGQDVYTDGSRNSTVTGTFNGTATFGSITISGDGIFIAKYDAAGNVLWVRQANGSVAEVVADRAGNILVAGTFKGTTTFGSITLMAAGGLNDYDIFIVKYDPSGKVLWAKEAGGNGYDSGTSVTRNRLGDIFVIGSFEGTATFGNTTLTSAGGSDIFIAKYDGSGNLIWAKRAGGASSDKCFGVSTDVANNTVIAGYFEDIASFDSNILTSAGNTDVYIAQLTESPTTLTVTSPNGGEVLYVGTTHTITWTCNNYVGLVEVALSKDGGSSWINLTDPYYAPNTGSYNYTPQPEHVSNNCLIQITSIENATVKDRSDGVFSIVDTYIDKHYFARRIPPGVSLPTIDGVLNESFWSLVDEDSLLFGGVPESWNIKWTQWNDNLVTWKAVWSEVSNKLYVAITIKDDIRGVFDNNIPNQSSFAPYLDECLEIFTDGDHSGGFYEGTYDNAQQWMVTGENKIVLDDYPNSSQYNLYTGTDLITKVSWGSNGNWICEAAFNIYNTFPTVRKILSIGDIIGWNIWYDDSDNETFEDGQYLRDHQVGWLYEGKANNNADYFGKLQLDGDIPYIHITSPVAGDVLLPFTHHQITWSSFATSGSVKIEFSINEGINWTVIVYSTPDDGSYSWMVPNTSSANCYVRITDTDGIPTDKSGPFQIKSDIHFKPIWSGNPFQPMTIYCTQALLHGQPLVAGDEIGVYDGDKCVGAVVLNQTPGYDKPAEIVCSKDDGTGNGFKEGNPILFRVWDQSGSSEYGASARFVDLQTGNPTNPVPFSGLGTAAVELRAFDVHTQSIALKPGWNIFSLAVIPQGSHDMLAVLAPILEPYVMKVIDERGGVVQKLFGNWYNSIGNWEKTEGYYINVRQSVPYQVTGTEIAVPLMIPLTAGWNIISYPCLSVSQNALTVVQPLINSGYLVKVIDEQGHSIIKIFGNWINSIGDMHPGEGYYVNVNTNCSITITCGGFEILANAPKQQEAIAPEHFALASTGHPFEPMNIFVVGAYLDGEYVNAGDEIAVYDGDQCVGASVLSGLIDVSDPLEIIASKDDGSGNGFMVGQGLRFKVWRSKTGEEIVIDASSVQYYDPTTTEVTAPMLFEGWGTAVAAINFITAIVDEPLRLPEKYSLYQNHPNPFNPTTTIRYDLPEATDLRIEIYDLQGNIVRRLFEGRQGAGHHAMEWDGRNTQGSRVGSGIYFYQLSCNKFIAAKKMILMK